MKLNRLIIQGFKSFKDKTVIHFDDGITGIVGPNGCGKSNIVDALFWVMGEQSAKHLRGTSMKDLIFAGSSKYQPASFAEVTLVLDNVNGKHIHIGGTVAKPTEIQLTRKLYRNGETEYRINNEPARLKDIHEVFMDTGAGAKSYSIIAQGEINKLVQAKPEERRVMIEEVAGITKFKLRKRESLKKIEQTQLNLTRLEDLQNEIYKNLKKLEQQAEKAEKARTLRERIKKYELIVESHREHEYLQDFVNAHALLETRATEHENLTLRKSQIDLLLEDEKIQKTDMMEKIDVAQDDYNEHSRELAASEEKVKHLKKSLVDKEKHIDRATRENEELSIDIEKRSERLETLTSQLTELESNNYEQMDFSALEEKVELLKGQMSDLEEELNEKRRELSNSKDRFHTLDNEAFKNSSKLEEYSRLLQDLTAEIETLEKSTSNFTDDLMRDRSKVKSSQAKVEELSALMPSLKEDVEKLTAELKAQDQNFRELSREVIQLESKRNSLIEINNSAEGRRAGAMKLVTNVGDGTLEILGKLIECDPEYAVAIERLIGESLDAVLATTSKDTFGALTADFDATVDLMWPTDSTISSESIGRLETQGCEGMKALSEIVRINNPEYEAKLQKILNGFFIVENLTTDLASRINPDIQFKGLVSRDGSVLIKKIGNSVVYGVRKDEASAQDGIVQRNNLIQEMGVTLDARQAELAILETTIMQTETTLSEKKTELEKISAEFNEINTIHAATKAALESKEANQSSNSQRLTILQSRKTETSGLRLSLIEADEKVINQKEDLEAAVKELASSVEDLESRYSEIKISFENERDEMLSLQVKAQSYQSQLSSLKSQIEDVNSQIDRYREKQQANMELLETYQNEIENAQTEVETTEASNREMADVLSDKESYLNLMKDQIAQILLSMQEKESELKEITSRLNKIEKENVELELRAKQIIEEEQLLVKDIFERYKIDLRATMMKHLEITSDKVTDPNRERVDQELEKAVARTGVPRQIVADGAADLQKGIERFRGRHPQTASVPDAAHHAANLLKHYWQNDPRWQAFTRRMNETAAAIRQTDSAYLLAPKLRNKARYMSVGAFVRFGRIVLGKLADGEPNAEVVRHYGWVSEYADALSAWSQQHELVQVMLRQVRVEGLFARGEAVLDEAWEPLGVSDHAVTVALRNRLRAYVGRYGRGLLVGERLIGSTEILESAFGVQKRLSRDQASSGLTVLSVGLGAMLGEATPEQMRSDVDRVPEKAVDNWAKRTFGKTVQWLHRQFVRTDPDRTKSVPNPG